MPILQAIVDGKTIQHKTINREWYDTNVASLDHLVTYYKDYRIKPETTYRPFKDAEECWAEMLEHQPFGWVKDRNGSKFVIENVDSGGLSKFMMMVHVLLKKCLKIAPLPTELRLV